MMCQDGTNLLRRAGKSIIAAITCMTLVACGSTVKTAVLVPPSELPYLGRTTATDFDGIPVVTTIDGQSHEFKGPIESVELTTRKRAVPVDVPFTARVDGDKLEVSTDQVRTYSLSDISYAMVEYIHEKSYEKRDKFVTNKPSRARRNVGLALGFGSIVPLSLGAVVLASDVHCGAGLAIGCGIAEAFQPVFGAALLLSGTGMLVTGVALGLSSSSSSTRRKTMTIQPQLKLSPTGGTLSFDF